MADILVFAEIVDGRPAPVVLELLTRARDLGSVDAVAIGPGADGAAAELGKYGAGTVHVAADAALGEVLIGGPGADALATVAADTSPALVLIGATYNGRDVAGRLSAKLDRPVIANGLELGADGGAFTVGTSIFGATENVRTRFTAEKPGIALVRPKSFAAEKGGGGAGTVQRLELRVDERHRRARVTGRSQEQSSGPKLEEAGVVISGGRGLGDPSNFAMLEELAGLLGGAVGASRAVVDAGWVPYAMQVGQTGKTVKPSVYIACGISGAMQHTVGMKGAKRIVAINRDADAPIFKLADLGVVGDVLKVVPALIEEVKRRKG